MTKPRHIPAPVIYSLAVAVVLVLFLALWRFILLVLSGGFQTDVPGRALFESFLVGMRFDFVIVSYLGLICLFPGVIPLVDIQRRRQSRKILTVLLFVLTSTMFFLHLVDIEFFKYFNARLNGVILIWNDSPAIALSMVWGMYPVVRYLLMYAALVIAFIFIVLRLQRGLLYNRPVFKPPFGWLFSLLVLTLFVIGSAGRLSSYAPMRWGVAYFSEYDYANLLALNPTYTLLRDILYDAGSKEQVRETVEAVTFPGAYDEVRQLFGMPPDTTGAHPRLVRRVTFDPPNPNPPNVIVIMGESLAANKIGVLNNQHPWAMSPNFDALSRKSILFTNFHSCGMHTYCAMISALCGNPHLMGKLIIKQVTGENHFYGLASILKDNGYDTYFFSTHDPHFDNMQGFLKSNGYMYYSSVYDYADSQRISQWGVPDHVMLDTAYTRLSRIKNQRYLATIMTVSNHGPWYVPEEADFERIPDTADQADRHNAFKYADWALGRFLDKIENDPAFANTLIVITGDNGFLYKPTADLDLSIFEIPLLIYNTDWNLKEGVRIDRLGCHLDLIPTVMGQVKINYDNYTFGHDLADSLSPATGYAHMTEWNKIGYIEGDYYLITRLDGPESLYRLSDRATDIAADHPDLVEEYKRKALALYQTAYYNMKLPLKPKNHP
ncbi:MAG: LTA synthase family protein [Candidatus Zixiibacteriota bacterium]